MYNIIVFPFNKEIAPLLLNSDIIKSNYKIVSLVSPYSWGYCGQTFEYGKDRIAVESDIYDAIHKKANVLFIPEYSEWENHLEYIAKSVKKITSHIDTVICCAKLTDLEKETLKQMFFNEGCDFIDCTPKSRHFVYNNTNYNVNEPLHKFSVPIIAIGGMLWSTDKFAISLALNRMLSSENYKSVLITPKKYMELLDIYCIPDFLYDSTVDELLKINLLNNFIYNIIKREKPDVILLEIPGSIQNPSDEILTGFGLLQYIMFNSVTVDFLIICTLFGGSTYFYKTISDYCYYRFGAEVDCYHMSSLCIDYDNNEKYNIKTYNVGNDIYYDFLESISTNDENIQIMNILKKDGIKRTKELILKKLCLDYEIIVNTGELYGVE